MGNDYESVYMGKSTEIENLRKVCMNCIDMVVKPNPQNPSSPLGILIAPALEILKVSEVIIDNVPQIEVHWLCQKCGRIRSIDLFDTFDNMLSMLEALKASGTISNTTDAVILILKEKKYEKLPGYTTSIAQRIVTNRK